MRDIKLHKGWVSKFTGLESIIGEVDILYEFYQEGEGTEEEVEQQYKKAFLKLEDVEFRSTPVSYTHLTLPTKRIV